MGRKPTLRKEQMVLLQDAVSGVVETAKVSVFVQKDAPKYKGEAFTLMFQGISRAISRKISPSASKMLLYFMAVVEYDNYIFLGRKEMSEELGYSLRQVDRALIELVDMKVVFKAQHPRDSRVIIYSLNPYQSWKGEVKARAKKISNSDPGQLELFPAEKHRIESKEEWQ